MRNKQVVLLIAGISGIVTGIIVSLNIPFIRQGLFYPASPVEIVVSLCLTFSVSVVFFDRMRRCARLAGTLCNGPEL